MVKKCSDDYWFARRAIIRYRTGREGPTGTGTVLGTGIIVRVQCPSTWYGTRTVLLPGTGRTVPGTRYCIVLPAPLRMDTGAYDRTETPSSTGISTGVLR